MLSLRPQWESWVLLRDGADGPVVKERRLRRHFTKRGAFRWADSLCHSPEVLSMTISSALRGTGTMVFADPDVRRRA